MAVTEARALAEGGGDGEKGDEGETSEGKGQSLIRNKTRKMKNGVRGTSGTRVVTRLEVTQIRKRGREQGRCCLLYSLALDEARRGYLYERYSTCEVSKKGEKVRTNV